MTKTPSILKDQRGVALILELILVALVILAVGFVGYKYFVAKNQNTVSPNLRTTTYQNGQGESYQLSFYPGSTIKSGNQLGSVSQPTTSKYLYAPDVKNDGLHLILTIAKATGDCQISNLVTSAASQLFRSQCQVLTTLGRCAQYVNRQATNR